MARRTGIVRSGGGELSRDETGFFLCDAAGVFQTAATTGTQTHFLGNILQRHAPLEALLQLVAIHVFADADDHGFILNENDS